jgi:hypothetical protein
MNKYSLAPLTLVAALAIVLLALFFIPTTPTPHFPKIFVASFWTTRG